MIITSVFGKGHDIVIRDIETIPCSEQFRLLNYEEIDYLDSKGRTQMAYIVEAFVKAWQ